MLKIGFIVGSGLEDINFIKGEKTFGIKKFFGFNDIIYTKIKSESTEICVICRHGIKHELYPHQVPFQKYMKIFKELECSAVIGFTACGSLRKKLEPGTLQPIDQFIDLSSKRKLKYPKKVTHMPMGEPFDKHITNTISAILDESPKTMVTVNGPRFSTRAESLYFKTIGGDLINMTTATECIAANIENIPYAGVGFVTDYDAWNIEIPHVTMDEIKSKFEEYQDELRTFIPLLLENLTKL